MGTWPQWNAGEEDLMRIFNTMYEAMNEIERDLFEMGINSHPSTYQDQEVGHKPEFETKEMLGYSFSIQDWEDRDDVLTDRIGYDAVVYCNKELLERLHGNENPGSAYRVREDLWGQFLHNGKFSYTYSERLENQREDIVDHLYHFHDTRQAIMTVYDKHHDLQNIGGVRRIPCSMYYHFLRRNIGGKDRLLLIYTMRSCDFYTHFPIDIWLASAMLDYYASQLKCDPYSLIYFCDSLHAYRKDWDKRRIF